MRLKPAILLTAAAFTFAVAAAPASAVVGGTPGTIPSLVEIGFADSAGEDLMCSGTIVSPNMVLTAGHCADGAASSYLVYLAQAQGTNGTGTSSNLGVAVSAVIPAPGFDAAANYVHDAALLVLSTPTTLPSIALASREPAGGTSAEIYGWGDTTSTGGSGIASTTGTTTIQGNAACSTFWGTWWAPSDMCADSNSVALGGGDSGGPLVVKGVEVGINDRAAGTSAPSIFTRVDQLDEWIQYEIEAYGPHSPTPAKHHRHKIKHHAKRHGIAKGSA
jgi:secreted trypsin-like serine protease